MAAATIVMMANQIADFFKPWPHDRCVEGIADHFQKYWDPAMRTELKRLIAAGEAPGLRAEAAEAAALVQDEPLAGSVKLRHP